MTFFAHIFLRLSAYAFSLSHDLESIMHFGDFSAIDAKFYYCKTLHPTKSRYGALDFNWIEFMFLNFHNFVEFYELSKTRWNRKPTQLYFSSSKPLFDSTTGIVAITRKKNKNILNNNSYYYIYFNLSKNYEFWLKWVYFDHNLSLLSKQAHFQNTPKPN